MFKRCANAATAIHSTRASKSADKQQVCVNGVCELAYKQQAFQMEVHGRMGLTRCKDATRSTTERKV